MRRILNHRHHRAHRQIRGRNITVVRPVSAARTSQSHPPLKPHPQPQSPSQPRPHHQPQPHSQPHPPHLPKKVLPKALIPGILFSRAMRAHITDHTRTFWQAAQKTAHAAWHPLGWSLPDIRLRIKRLQSRLTGQTLYRISSVFMALVLLVTIVFPVLNFDSAEAATATILPDTTITTTPTWTQCNAGTCTNDRHTYINEDATGSYNGSTFIGTGATGTSEAAAAVEFGFTTVGNVDSASSITVNIAARSQTNASGGTLDDIDIQLRIAGSLLTAVRRTPAFSTSNWFLYSATFNGTWTQANLDGAQVLITRVVQGSGNPTNQRDDVRIAALSADVTYTSAVTLEQSSYRWFENANTTSPGPVADWTKVNNPNIPTSTGNARDAEYKPSSNYMVMVYESSPYFSIFDTSDSNPENWQQIANSNISIPGLGHSVDFNSDGSLLVVSSSAGVSSTSVRLFDTSNSDPAQWTEITGVFSVTLRSFVKFSPDDNVLVVGSDSQTSPVFRFFDTSDPNPANWAEVTNTSINNALGSVFARFITFSLDGNALILGGSFGGDTLVDSSDPDPANWSIITNPSFDTSGTGGKAFFTSDGNTMVVTASVSSITLVDTSDPNPANWANITNTNLSYADIQLVLGFSPDENLLFFGPTATSAIDGNLHVVDSSDPNPANWDKISSAPPEIGERPRVVLYAPGSNTILIPLLTSTDPTLEIINIGVANIGTPYATQDTPTTAPAEGTPFRLRASLSADQGELPADTSFKLQYAERQGLTCTLDFSAGEVYQDVEAADQIGILQSTDKIADPATLPTGDSYGTAFSPNGQYLTVAHSVSPFLTIYKADYTTGSFTKLANPTNLPPAAGKSVSFSNDGKYLSVSHDTSPFITIYDIDYATDTFTKVADPATTPTGTARGMAFSPNDRYLSVAHYTSPFLTIYRVDSTTNTFTKLNNPATLPAGAGQDVFFSPDGKYMSVAHLLSPFLTTYEVNMSTNTFTKLTDPSVLPTGDAYDVAYSPNGKYLSVVHYTSPFVALYEVDYATNTFTKLPNPSSLPTGNARGSAFSPDGKYLTIAHYNSPYMTTYEIDYYTDTFTKLPNPNGLPTSTSHDVSYSPDGEYLSIVDDGASPYVFIYKLTYDYHPLKFHDNTSIFDGSGIASSVDDPNPGSGNKVLQSYVESNTFTNPNAIPLGDYGVWDFSLVDNNAPAETPYCFRIVDSGGSVLSTYSVIPELTTVPPTYTQADYRWFDEKEMRADFYMLDNPTQLPTNDGYDTAFSPDGKYLSVAHNFSPFITIYEIDSTTNTFTKLADPASFCRRA
jgi:6-phosphogluconolactonase (cycloisomerase 2 family)